MRFCKHAPLRRGWAAFVTAALVTAGGTAGVVALAPTPAQSISLVSEQQELEAGRQAAEQVEQKYRVVTGTREARLVEQIGRRMAAVSGRPNLPWKFRVIEEKSVNAFSVPGYVYIHTGLLDQIGGDTDALAGVIAHEVAHTDARHSKEHMEKSAVAGFLGSLIRDRTAASIANIGGSLILLKHSRDDEYESDRLAVRYLQRTGHDPNGMIRFFQKLQKQEGGSGGPATWFRTHPNSGDRINRIRGLINNS